MTREELKANLAPIVCDVNLTKEERTCKLGPYARTWLDECDAEGTSLDDALDTWNRVMVEIVDENHLGVH